MTLYDKAILFELVRDNNIEKQSKKPISLSDMKYTTIDLLDLKFYREKYFSVKLFYGRLPKMINNCFGDSSIHLWSGVIDQIYYLSTKLSYNLVTYSPIKYCNKRK